VEVVAEAVEEEAEAAAVTIMEAVAEEVEEVDVVTVGEVGEEDVAKAEEVGEEDVAKAEEVEVEVAAVPGHILLGLFLLRYGMKLRRSSRCRRS